MIYFLDRVKFIYVNFGEEFVMIWKYIYVNYWILFLYIICLVLIVIDNVIVYKVEEDRYG